MIRNQQEYEEDMETRNNIRRFLIKAGLSALLIVVGLLTCCTKIQPGYVGIRINQMGDSRGVSEIPIKTGAVFSIPFIQSIYEYPTSVQTATWDGPESICFNTSDRVNPCAGINLSYQLEQNKIPAFYVKFRNDDLNVFTHGFLRNVARDVFNEVSIHYTLEEVNAAKKQELLEKVSRTLTANLKEYGLIINQFGFTGALKVPQDIQDSMNNSVKATQKAQQVENELRETRAEAQKKIAEAEGIAQAAITKAQGEAEANRLLSASITSELLESKRLDIIDKHWDGKSPLVTTNGVLPTLDIPKN